MFTFKLDEIPFSLPGSFLTITSRNTSGSTRLVYKTCSARVYNDRDLPYSSSEFFEIALIRDGNEVPYTWTAQPHCLELIAGDPAVTSSASTADFGKVLLAFSEPDTLVFETQGVGLRLLPCKPYPVEYHPTTDQVCLVDWIGRGTHEFRATQETGLQATITKTVSGLDSHWHELPRSIEFSSANGSNTASGAIRFSRYEETWDQPLPILSETLAARQKEFTRWMRRLPDVPEDYFSLAEQAWFILWNCQVPPQGPLTRPAIYMSKFWMNAIWAWDNCFNALAVARADPEAAWNQLLLFFDHQEPHGMIPDMINDLEPIYGFNKPPIQGWTIRKLVNSIGIKKSLPYLRELYKPVGRLTEWWYRHRDFDNDGMPQYHHGNDSGWDNATAFDQGCPTEGADLAAFLVLQCEGLAFMAELLEHRKGAARWQARAGQQLTDLLSKGMIENHFFSPLDGHSEAPNSQSLINFIPVILAQRLPRKVRKALVADLAPGGPFLTPFGLATESPQSSKYETDGYWRGPIWAPSTYLIFDGLVEMGETELARTIAERFCNMCLREPGFWENYDALTGKGLRCPGYSWTASVFLLLAEWLQANRRF
jgi:putative isomerase